VYRSITTICSFEVEREALPASARAEGENGHVLEPGGAGR